MSDDRPSYEELEQRIKELEEKVAESTKPGDIQNESEHRFRLISETLPVGIFETDANSECLYHEAMKNPLALMHREWFQKRDDPEVMLSPIHCDRPQFVVNWSGIEDVHLDRPLSITLAIALPASGAGMYVWNLSMDETVNMPETEVFQLLQSRNRSLHKYHLGQLALHPDSSITNSHPFGMFSRTIAESRCRATV